MNEWMTDCLAFGDAVSEDLLEIVVAPSKNPAGAE